MIQQQQQQQRCNACGPAKSIYGKICGECQNCELLNDRDGYGGHQKPALHKKKKKKKVKILSTLDILISVFIVTPLVVACWRGTWQLIDIYAKYFPPWESFIIGTLIFIVIGISQESFNGLINRKHKSWIQSACAFMFMKLYTIVLNVITNMQWRGGWIIIDQYFGIKFNEAGVMEVQDPRGAFSFFAICFLLMFTMRCLRNLNSPPFEIHLDYGDDMFLFPNMFKVKVSERISLYVLDVIFSTAIVTNLVIVMWRGLWLAVDLYFFPLDELLSAWGSAFLGYVMVAITFMLQPIMKRLCDNLKGIPRLLVADAYMMFSVIGVIFVWRGIWYLLNIYFLPDNEELSCWITLWIPMLILILMGCANSLLVRGVCLDCEEPDGQCVVFPCNYLRVIFDQEKYDTWFSIWTGVAQSADNDSADNDHPRAAADYRVIRINDDVDNNNVGKSNGDWGEKKMTNTILGS